jgi:hypothetical protein
LSPGAGAIWYCPTLVLSILGLARWHRTEKLLCRSVLAASAGFMLFISMLTFFKGDLSWGPRYLTPVFAVWWLFAPAGAALLRPRLVAVVLLAGMAVQLLGLSVDPHRLYLQRKLWSRFYVVNPWLYFHPAIGHLGNRPREIVEILSADTAASEAFTPARSPTYALPILEHIPQHGPQAVEKYHVFNALRPWWLSQAYLKPWERPVDLGRSWVVFSIAALAGLALMTAGSRLRGTLSRPVP